MVDFLAMFDAILNTISVTKSAAEVSESDDKNAKKRRDFDDVEEDTKSRTHKIVEDRKKKLAERRADQYSLQDKNQHRNKQ
ncbi:hypothetical protein OAS86_01310 [Gammaproteobacteria bacterium]|nr:hypothetical protein [Gammaproteobacteria bacterium]